MKKLFTILAALAVVCCILAGCGQGAALEQGSKVYDGNAVFELGEANTENFSVSIPEKGTGSVERIVIGSKNYTEDFSYSGGVLTIAAGLRVSKIKNVPLTNLLPSLIFVMPLSSVWASIF